MAKHTVKCSICNQYFDANAESYVMTSARRYAHKSCVESAEQDKTKEQHDKEELEQYVKDLFGLTTLTPKIKRQIDSYHTKQGYSYSGIRKSLQYFYEVRGNSLEKANGGIGIVPYVWQEALIYHRALYEAQQQNAKVQIDDFIVPAKEVHIAPPRREPMKQLRQLFTFLNDIEEAEEE